VHGEARRCSHRRRRCSYNYLLAGPRCLCCAWRPLSAKHGSARSHSGARRISHSRLERRCLRVGGGQSCIRTPPSSSQANGSELRPWVVAREPLVAKRLERALCGNKIEDKRGFISSTLSQRPHCPNCSWPYRHELSRIVFSSGRRWSRIMLPL
jgi:hypothetical protein